MNKIVGYENVKKELAQLKNILLKSDAYKACGIRAPRGLVLFGEPGVGKTRLARTLAGDGVTLIELRAASCSKDNAQEALDSVFLKAKENRPSVILLDELDKIAGTSDKYYMEDNSFVQRILLQALDSLGDADNVLVAATCNDTCVLGEMLLRPGRFDRILRVDEPDEETRERILEEYFNELSFKKELDYKRVAQMIPGYTGARIECLANEAGIRVMNDGRDTVTLEDVRAAMNDIELKGREKKQTENPERLRAVAVHEAGHAVVALTLAPDCIFGASVLPHGDTNGHIHFVSAEESVKSVAETENEIAVLLGGHVAERAALGEYYLGSRSDLGRAEYGVRRLAEREGAYGYKGIVQADHRVLDAVLIAETDREIVDKLNELDSKAEEIIRKNRAAFNRIVDALMEKQMLTREELLDLFYGAGSGLKSAV
ncbi:MAG: AAA family ATPase [Clostridia bacterium]|nr:AAA family ATPase [Clostridia bacterium]